MFQARYQYENHLVGEWYNVTTESILYPNPEYRSKIVGVQFRETDDLPQSQSKTKLSISARWKIDPQRKVITNG